ncbi:GNAT family N-acetyltransferase [Mumia quercus]|uniref:GNAT family N-acetyltransferase n=1 Tax=Mumia quercus TaxID=2976125 RepID=UPI0021D1030D|nr:GNAT family N-acetyltransferase [Mumia quercus]
MAYELLRPVEGDWEQVRDLRLRALKDTPIAYGERYGDAVRLDEAEWRTRAARGDAQDSVQVVARLTDGEAAGRWVGTMAAFVSRGLPPYLPGAVEEPDAPRQANLVGVFVDPQVRGRGAGVAEALLDAVVAWARDEQGLDRLHLHVHEDNPRAAAFYRRYGFVATGESYTDVLHPGAEREMVLPLD